MHYYSKILAPFKREDNKSKYVTEGIWSKPEFELLKDISWSWTFKCDGTNISLQWRGDKMTLDNVKGHTDKSEFNQRTKDYLEKTFCTAEAETIFEDMFGEQNVNIILEFVSKDMNQNYGHLDGYCYVIDVQNADTGKFWTRDIVEEFAKRFNIDYVREMCVGTIKDATTWIKLAKASWNDDKYHTTFLNASNGNSYKVENPYGKYSIEGLVGRPQVELLDSNKERIITKVKCKDFAITL